MVVSLLFDSMYEEAQRRRRDDDEEDEEMQECRPSKYASYTAVSIFIP